MNRHARINRRKDEYYDGKRSSHYDGSVAKLQKRPVRRLDMLPGMRKSRTPLFKWRHFEPAVITCAVGWYLRFSLSYRNVEELLTERGLTADHTTVWRWVQRYAPELNRRCRKELKSTNRSWRVDETYIRVKGK